MRPKKSKKESKKESKIKTRSGRIFKAKKQSLSPPRANRKAGSGQHFNQVEKDILKNVKSWLAGAIKREKYGGKVFPHTDKTALLTEICGISSRSAQNVSNWIISTDSNDPKYRGGRKPIELDECNQSSLRRVILGFYARQPAEIPTFRQNCPRSIL